MGSSSSDEIGDTILRMVEHVPIIEIHAQRLLDLATTFRDTIQKEVIDISNKFESYVNMETERRIETERTLENSKTENQDLQVRNAALQLQLSERSKKILGNFVEFSRAELEQVTNNFDKSCMIGEGGYGSVYKGFLRYTNVAIKIPKSQSFHEDNDYNREVEILTKIRHPNIVSFLGINPDARALVFEYVPNGSLDKFLTRGRDSLRKLSWKDRIRIASEICSVLIFLHSVPPHGIVHGDLKPANILLDSYLTSKLADFGISRKLKKTDNRTTVFHFTEVPKCTPVYCAPEFLSSYELTTQCDIYSFGIILLQFITGKSPQAIWYHVEEAIKTGKLMEEIDNSAGWPIEEAKKLAVLGLRCGHPESTKRPSSFKDVWPSIESIMRVAALHNKVRNSFGEQAVLERRLQESKTDLSIFKLRLEQLKIERDGALEKTNPVLENVEESSRLVPTFTKFSRSELDTASNNFHLSRKIEENNDWIVYKGFLRYTTVAIKLFSNQTLQGDRMFNKEVEIVSKARHPNVVSFIGACPEVRAVVYEFLPNGSFETFLSNGYKSRELFTWQNRIRVASEICSALIFLHSLEPRGIVHGQMNTECILLDSNFGCKLAHLGISSISEEPTNNDTQPLYTTRVPNIHDCYMAPEYICSFEMTPRCDIYSFGIILLQLITGKKARRITMIAADALEKDKLDMIVDGSAGKWPIEETKKMISLGLACSDVSSENRPDLATCVWPSIETMKGVAGLL